jgi:hypothetical protein
LDGTANGRSWPRADFVKLYPNGRYRGEADVPTKMRVSLRERPLLAIMVSPRTAAFQNHDRRLMAGRVKSPMAASEHSSSQNLDLADWPVSRNVTGGFGSEAEHQGFAAAVDLRDAPKGAESLPDYGPADHHDYRRRAPRRATVPAGQFVGSGLRSNAFAASYRIHAEPR